MLAAEDGMRSASRADHNVGLAGCVVKLFEGDHLPRKALRHAPRALQRAVGHQNRAGSLLHQMARGQLAHLARAHQENRAPLQRAEDFARQFHGHRGD